jgi:site-specific DNA-methyltransferase (adenine-specific)
MMIQKALFSSASVDWETPQFLFDGLNAEFGLEVDVCASASNAKCKKYYTEAENGLAQDWGTAVCWMNPPYGRKITGLWMRKAYESARRGATVVCLVPARTDTDWWHRYAKRGEVRLLRGRLRFGGSATAAPFPSAVIIFRPGCV